MNIVQICGIAVIALTAALTFRQMRPEYTPFVAVTVGIILLGGVLTALVPFLRFVDGVTATTGFSLYTETILKVMGIGLLAQTTADVCRDSGEAAIASKVEFSSKIVILLLALPVLKALLSEISVLLGNG